MGLSDTMPIVAGAVVKFSRLSVAAYIRPDTEILTHIQEALLAQRR